MPGLYFAQARFYDLAVEWFISEDPAKDGANLYAYVGNNLVNCIDPTGEFAFTLAAVSISIKAIMEELLVVGVFTYATTSNRDVIITDSPYLFDCFINAVSGVLLGDTIVKISDGTVSKLNSFDTDFFMT